MRFAVLILASCLAVGAQALAAKDDVCVPATSLTPLPELPEASGITAALDGSVLFAVNDSGAPVVSVLSHAGAMIRQLTLPGARVIDWEDVTAARCGNGSCLYIADIGDNNRNREALQLYRIPQPRDDATSVAKADVFTVAYPDRPRDAESMFATRSGQLYIATKESGGTHVYRVPPFQAGGRAMLEPVATVDFGSHRNERVTDADASSDGTWVALRTNETLLFYRTSELTSGRSAKPIRVSLKMLGEPQGEGVTFGAGGAMYLVGEGGGRRRPGTFAALRCSLPATAHQQP